MCFSPVNTTVSNICPENPYNLSCGEGKLIMIKGIHYKQTTGPAGNNCSACNKGANATVWNIKPSYFEDRLHKLCSLQEKCDFNESVEAPSNESNYVWQAMISYTCIQNGNRLLFWYLWFKLFMHQMKIDRHTYRLFVTLTLYLLNLIGT